MEHLVDILRTMATDRVRNYVLPGVTSSIATMGKVRILDSERDTDEFLQVAPHSHRYDFAALVLRGRVINTLYHNRDESHSLYPADECMEYGRLSISYNGEPGQYKMETYDYGPELWTRCSATYTVGETYLMRHDEIHSISFDKGTSVLMLEGPDIQNDTHVLVPWVDGKAMTQLFKVEPWMFKKEML